jgi:hypothetical protein
LVAIAPLKACDRSSRPLTYRRTVEPVFVTATWYVVPVARMTFPVVVRNVPAVVFCANWRRPVDCWIRNSKTGTLPVASCLAAIVRYVPPPVTLMTASIDRSPVRFHTGSCGTSMRWSEPFRPTEWSGSSLRRPGEPSVGALR